MKQSENSGLPRNRLNPHYYLSTSTASSLGLLFGTGCFYWQWVSFWVGYCW